jgi:cephalosporin hydroxylase
VPRLRERSIRVGFGAWRRIASRLIARLYHYDLIHRTGNFADARWLGTPIWQNVLDLWTIQETIAEIRPALLIETGTHRGGSALFYAHLMDELDCGRVMTIDIVDLHERDHPRVEFVHGSSTDPAVVERARAACERAYGPVMVILDGDHSRDHVAAELEIYGPMVTPGSVLLSQDGIIDEFWVFKGDRPGPLPANRAFLASHPEFEYDRERTERFGLTHHPLGWMRRRAE